MPWQVGLRETLATWPPQAQELNVRILPLPAGAPMYLEKRPAETAAIPAGVDSVTLVPEYQLHVITTPAK